MFRINGVAVTAAALLFPLIPGAGPNPVEQLLLNEWRVLEANPILNPAAMFNDARGGNTKPNIMIGSPYIEVDMKGQCTLIVALVTTHTVPKGSELLGSYGDESFWIRSWGVPPALSGGAGVLGWAAF